MPKIAHEVLHAARGAVVGAAVGEAMARTADAQGGWPREEMGGAGELTAEWGSGVEELITVGEFVARGEAPPFDVGLVGVVSVAIADAVGGRGAPLLTDPDAAAAHGVIGGLVLGPTVGSSMDLSGPVGLAVQAAGAPSFADALRDARDLSTGRDVVALAGAFAGAHLGVTAIPSRWLSYVEGSGGTRRHRHRDLLRLADRLVGFDVRLAPDPRRRIGPVEVLDGVWAANAHRVPSFCERFPDGAVISMCPMGDVLDGFPGRRTFLIEDVPVRGANPRLAEVVDELVASIAAFRTEGRQVLVHCHHGVSRTGLALRAWLMDGTDLDESSATSEVEARWPWLSTANARFTQLLQDRSASTSTVAT